jgi:hypothetical protein
MLKLHFFLFFAVGARCSDGVLLANGASRVSCRYLRSVCVACPACVPLVCVAQRTAEALGHLFPRDLSPAQRVLLAAPQPSTTPPAANALEESDVYAWTFVGFLDRAALLRRVNK